MSNGSNKTPPLSLSALVRQRPNIAETFWLLSEQSRQLLDDRAIAILEAAQVDRSLEVIIKYKLIKLNSEDEKNLFIGDSAPLSTFSAKTKMAFALGIFGRKTRKELDIIRTIRNAFAHAAKPLTFSTSQITDECSKLIRKFSQSNPKTAREQYIQSASYLSASLISLKFPQSDDSDFDLD